MFAKFVCFLTALTLIFSCMTGFAVAPEDIYTEYTFYSATVYICDTENQQIILRNVKPQNPMDGLVGARSIEYNAVGVNSNCIFDKNGQSVSLETVNGNLLDIEATVLVGKSRRGQRVLYISF